MFLRCASTSRQVVLPKRCSAYTLSLIQTIHTCTRSTHQCGECTRLDIAVNIVKEPARTPWNRDMVVDGFPSKRPAVNDLGAVSQ